MPVQSPLPTRVHSPFVEPASPAVPVVDTALEERWAAWQARGRRRDAVVQRRFRLIIPIAAGLVLLGLAFAGGLR